MRKLWNAFGWAILRSTLYVTLLFLPLFATFCHAQCYGAPPGQGPIATLSPQYWAPGQTYNVTVTNPQGQFVDVGVPYTYVSTAYYYDMGDSNIEAPYVTVSNPWHTSAQPRSHSRLLSPPMRPQKMMAGHYTASAIARSLSPLRPFKSRPAPFQSPNHHLGTTYRLFRGRNHLNYHQRK